MSPEIARQVVDLFTRFRPADQADHGLTPHELRVLGLLVEGYDLSTAARRLGVARATRGSVREASSARQHLQPVGRAGPHLRLRIQPARG